MSEIFTKLGIDGNLIIAQVVNFVLLLVILQKLAYKPIAKMLEDRTNKIDKSLKQAQKIEEELKNTEAAKVAEIRKAKEEAQKIIKEANELAEKKTQESIEKARVKTQEIIERAKMEIKNEKEKSVSEAKREIADISIEIARKILHENIDADSQKKLVDETLANVKI